MSSSSYPPPARAPPSTPEKWSPTNGTATPTIIPPCPQQTFCDKQGVPAHFLPLIKRLKPALVLENSGSVARDHLASERTFLAYVRTSLAIASTGVALVQLFTIASTAVPNGATSFTSTTKRLQTYARPLGATTILFGLIVLAMGVIRYFVIQKALTKGMFPVARMGIAGITAVLAVIVAIVFGLLVSGRT